MGSRRIRTVVLAGAIAMLALASGCAPPYSALTQIRAIAACITDTGYGGVCRDGRFLDFATAASTPDGRFVYVVTRLGSSLSIVNRKSNGELAQKTGPAGCWWDTDFSGDDCKRGRALGTLTDVVATKNFVVVASLEDDAVSVFARNPQTGTLSQPAGKAGCISQTGRSDAGDPTTAGQCAIGRNLDGPTSLAVTGNMIVVGTDGGLALIKRNPETGKLSQPAGAKGCVTNDGSQSCANGHGIVDAARAVAVKLPVIYLAVGNAILVIVRAPDGTLSQSLGTTSCISENGDDGEGGICQDGRALREPSALLAFDGTVLVASNASTAVAQFTRDPATGSLTQGEGAVGCISETGESFPGEGNFTRCADGHHLHAPTSLARRGSTIFVGSRFHGDSTAPGAVAAIARDVNTAALSQGVGAAGCINDGEQDDGCLEGSAIDDVTAVTVARSGPVFATSVGVEDLGGRRHEGGVSALNYNGAFSQGVDGKVGCVSETGQSDAGDPATAGACINGVGLDRPWAGAVSPDGKNVYVVTGSGAGAVAVFKRNTTTGALKQLPDAKACISENGSGQCANGRALAEATDVVVSPDGKHVYVSAGESGGVAAFKRKASNGALTQLSGAGACITESGTERCTDGRALAGASALAISPNGEQVYVAAAAFDAVSMLDRDPATGVLTQTGDTVGCVAIGLVGCDDAKAIDFPRDLTLTPNGESLYVASANSAAIAVFSRHAVSGALTQLADPNGCVSETGRSDPADAGTAGECATNSLVVTPVSVVSNNGAVYARTFETRLSVFSRAGSGALTADGCFSETGADTCADGSALTGAGGQVATTGNPDVSVYIASPDNDGIAAFDREDSTGDLVQVASPFGCVTDVAYESCTVGKALHVARSIAISPDGQHVYVMALDDDAVAIFGRSLPPFLI